MTELQTGLIGLGVFAVGVVVAYNKWQEIRHRKVAESVLKPASDDVLLGSAIRPAREPADLAMPRSEPEFRAPEITESQEVEVREEPVFTVHADAQEQQVASPIANDFFTSEPGTCAESSDESPEPAAPADASQALAVEDLPSEPVTRVPSTNTGKPAEVPGELLDSRLEFIVSMEMVDMVPARQILSSQRDVLHKLHKPVHWVGYNESTQSWERLVADSELAVNRLRVGLQLVNRLGPIAGGDIAIFTGAMQSLADELMAVLDIPTTRLLDQAAQLDAFCASVDLEIGLNLVSRGQVFPGTKIRALAESAGMVLTGDGLFTRFDDAGRPLFYLQNYETTAFSSETLRSLNTHGLTFLLDVPRVTHGEKVFNQMTELARRFADALNGVLVDDNRQPLGDPQLDHIRREFIGKPQVTMIQYGMAAGSPQAMRLFS